MKVGIHRQRLLKKDENAVLIELYEKENGTPTPHILNFSQNVKKETNG